MSCLNKYLKSFISLILFSSFLSFLLSFVYLTKDNIFNTFLSFCNAQQNTEKYSNNILFFNYKKNNDEFIVLNNNNFLMIENINYFSTNAKVIFKEQLKTDCIEVFVEKKADNKNKIINIPDIRLSQDGLSFEININKSFRNLIIKIGDNIGESFVLDKIILCNDYKLNLDKVLKYDFQKELKNKIFWIRYLIFLMLVFFIGLHFIFDINILYEWLYKNKYYIFTFVVLFVVLFELNNSSIGLWKNIILDTSIQSNTILGTARNVRADELGVYTPMLLSQSPEYSYFNDIVRGTKTDMFMIYGQPVKNMVSVFRPFLLPFLFLGTAKGLSCFWILRLILLFWISFEFLLIITSQNKKLALIGTLLITFSPIVQWWFTPSYITDVLIFGELMIVLLYNYMSVESINKRITFTFLFFISAGSYILILYPAWQIPFFYVFIMLIILLFVNNFQSFKFSKKEIGYISLISVLFFVLFSYIFYKSRGTIDIITHTVYPGNRIEFGGGTLVEIFQYWSNIFLPVQNNYLNNVSEQAVFFDFFPLGLILSLIVIFKDKIKDRVLIFLLLLDLIFSVWCFIGFPAFLSKITFLSYSTGKRVFICLGFINILLLIRSLSLIKFKFGKILAITVSVILSIFVFVFNVWVYQLSIIKTIFVLLLSFILYYMILKNKINKFFISLIVIIMFVSGVMVNPVEKGIAVINDSQLSKSIRLINDNDKGLWIVDKLPFPVMNYPIMQGAATFNSTNTYPNLEAFKQLDKENKYENIYNRYCHIFVNLIDINNTVDKFILKNADCILINMTTQDLITLNVKYILSSDNSLERFGNDKIQINKIYKDSQYFIYKTDIKGEI